MIKITDVPMSLNFDEREMRQTASMKLRVPEKAIKSVAVGRKSVDARRKDSVRFVCTLEVEIDGEAQLIARLKNNKVQIASTEKYHVPEVVNKLDERPIVVGFGPAGMFAALVLAKAGAKPIVLERGQSVEKRKETVENFWKTRKLNPDSNVQFGEGGAGAFSDGKLTTGTKDIRIRWVLEELVKAGAPESILVDAKPHVGTDRLPKAVAAIREEIIKLGGEVFFETAVENFDVKNGRLVGLEINKHGSREKLECSKVILAIGHSARDTFESLHNIGTAMEAKAFSVGARIEHPQEIVDKAQYGASAGSPVLGAAEYKLAKRTKTGRGVYTFCMCPGGEVVAAASEEGGVVTNGMSAYARDGKNANSALLVGVGPEDFGSGVFDGVEFQRKIERAAFELAGGNYSAPAQTVGDFLHGVESKSFGKVKPTYAPDVMSTDITKCLPDFVTEAMKEGINLMGRSLRGFDMPAAILTAPETRSSSPIRILRNTTMQSINIAGLYPSGEGAGYAGGIVSAAVDGIKSAEAVLGLLGQA